MSGTRRGLLAATAGALPLASMAAAQPNPDAKLIQLCAEFSVLQQQTRAAWEDASLSDRERNALLDPISAAQRLLLDPIYEMEAATLAGVVARLEMIHLYDPQLLDDPQGWDEEMISALLHDALAVLKGGAS